MLQTLLSLSKGRRKLRFAHVLPDSRSIMIAEMRNGAAKVPFAGADIPSEAVISTCVHCGLCLPVLPDLPRDRAGDVVAARPHICHEGGRRGADRAGQRVFQEQMSAVPELPRLRGGLPERRAVRHHLGGQPRARSSRHARELADVTGAIRLGMER